MQALVTKQAIGHFVPGSVCPVQRLTGTRARNVTRQLVQTQARAAAVGAPARQEVKPPVTSLEEPDDYEEVSSFEDETPSAEVVSVGTAGALVRFKTHFVATFGDTLKVVGATPELGEWDPNQAPSLTWSEGDWWAGDVQLPAGDWELKVVVQTAAGDAVWEPGENRALQVPELEPGQLLVAELVYGMPQLMEPAVQEAAAAASPEAEGALVVEEAADIAQGPEPETIEAEAVKATVTEANTAEAESKAQQAVAAEQAPEVVNATAASNGNGAEAVAQLVVQEEQQEEQITEAPQAAEPSEAEQEAQLPMLKPGNGVYSFEEMPAAEAALKAAVDDRAQAELEQHAQAISLAAAVAAAAVSSAEEVEEAPAQAPDTPASAAADSAAPEAAPAVAPALPDTKAAAAASMPAADVAAGSGGSQLLGAVLGIAAVATVLYSEYVLKQTGCGLPPGPNGLLGAAEGVSYLAVAGLAAAGTVKRAQGKGGLQGPLVLPEVLSYVAIAAGAAVLYLQVQEHGYIPPMLPGGACYADSAATSLPPLAQLPSLPSVSLPSFNLPHA